jgi:hypothetical protein
MSEFHLFTWIIMKEVEKTSIFNFKLPEFEVTRSDNDTPFSVTSWVDCGESLRASTPEAILPVLSSVNEDVLRLTVSEILHKLVYN